MDIITYTSFRKHLKSHLDKVRSSRTPLTVTCAADEDIVVLPKADFSSMEETFYLFKSPNNAKRLIKGIEDYEKGLAKERTLIA